MIISTSELRDMDEGALAMARATMADESKHALGNPLAVCERGEPKLRHQDILWIGEGLHCFAIMLHPKEPMVWTDGMFIVVPRRTAPRIAGVEDFTDREASEIGKFSRSLGQAGKRAVMAMLKLTADEVWVEQHATRCTEPPLYRTCMEIAINRIGGNRFESLRWMLLAGSGKGSIAQIRKCFDPTVPMAFPGPILPTAALHANVLSRVSNPE